MQKRSVTLETVYTSIQQLQQQLAKLLAIVAEEEELSDEALAALEEARQTPEEEYVRLE